MKGTYTSEIEETLKCRGENRDPYILLRVVCVHMVCAPQYCNYMYLLVVILIQLLSRTLRLRLFLKSLSLDTSRWHVIVG